MRPSDPSERLSYDRALFASRIKRRGGDPWPAADGLAKQGFDWIGARRAGAPLSTRKHQIRYQLRLWRYLARNERAPDVGGVSHETEETTTS